MVSAELGTLDAMLESLSRRLALVKHDDHCGADNNR